MSIASHTIKPVKDNVLVKHIPEIERNGILLPNVHEKNFTAEVISVGSKVTDVSTGEKVVFTRGSRNVWDLEDGEYLTIREKDILFVLE